MGEFGPASIDQLNPAFMDAYRAQPKTAEVRTQRVEHEGMAYAVSVNILPPLSLMRYEKSSRRFGQATEGNMDAQYAHFTTEPRKKAIKIALTELRQGRAETGLAFALIAAPEHDILFGKLIEMGMSNDEVLKIARTGLPVRFGNGLRTRMTMQSDYDFAAGIDTKYTDNWDIFYSSYIRNPESVRQLQQLATKIATVGHDVLTPIAREITGHPRLGEELDLNFAAEHM